MSFLSLGKRLLPARKLWNVFTTKLQSKLHKLHKSKAMKKPAKNRRLINRGGHGNSTRPPLLPSLSSLQPRLRRKKRKLQLTHTRYYHHSCRHQKKTQAPVFIDELFVKWPASVRMLQPASEAETSTRDVGKNSNSTCPVTRVSTEKGAGANGSAVEHALDSDGHEKIHAADEMWEALALASPQMHGINERAEDFITRFRAEMQLQEMLARGLWH